MASKSNVVEDKKKPDNIVQLVTDDETEETGEKDKVKLTFQTEYSAIHIRVYAEHFGCKPSASFEEMVEFLVNGIPRVVNGLEKHLYFVDSKLHDMDTDKSDPVEPKPKKPHIHLIIWYLKKGRNGWQETQKLGALIHRLDKLGLHFRIKNADGTKGEDWNHFQTFRRLMVKGTQDGSLTAMVAYLDHDTIACKEAGKHIYPPADLDLYRWTNDLDKVKSFCAIYKACYDFQRNAKGVIITSKPELKMYYKNLAYALGQEGGDYHQWFLSLPANIQVGGFDKLLAEWYRYGADEYLDSDVGINNTRCVIFINGKKNVGKTYNSALVLREMGLKTLEIEGGKTGKFDTLTSSHGAMVVSDTGLSDYLAVCDDKFTYLYRRNNSNPLWCGKYLIITFNGTLEDYLRRFAKDFFFDKDDDDKLIVNDSFDALKSRIYECVCDDKGLHLRDKDSLAVRGMYEKQMERHLMFKSFRDRFNKAQQAYIGSLKGDKPSALVELEKALTADAPIEDGWIEVTDEMLADVPFD